MGWLESREHVPTLVIAGKGKGVRGGFAGKGRWLRIVAIRRAVWWVRCVSLRERGAENAARQVVFARACVIARWGFLAKAGSALRWVKRLRVVRAQRSANKEHVSEATVAWGFAEKSLRVKRPAIVPKARRVCRAAVWGESRLCIVVRRRVALRERLAKRPMIRMESVYKRLLVSKIAIAASRGVSKARKDAPKSWLVASMQSAMSNAPPKKADATRTQESVLRGLLVKKIRTARADLVSRLGSCAKSPMGGASGVFV